MSVFVLLLKREARLLCRRPAELANPLVFFAIVVALFPLAVGPQMQLLQLPWRWLSNLMPSQTARAMNAVRPRRAASLRLMTVPPLSWEVRKAPTTDLRSRSHCAGFLS